MYIIIWKSSDIWKNVFHKGKRNTKFTYNWHSKEYYELSPKFCHNKNFKQAWLSYSCTWHSELKNGVLFSFLKKFWNILIFKSLRYQSCNPLNTHIIFFTFFFIFTPMCIVLLAVFPLLQHTSMIGFGLVSTISVSSESSNWMYGIHTMHQKILKNIWNFEKLSRRESNGTMIL